MSNLISKKKKKIRSRKNGGRDVKTLHKLMNNPELGKSIENLGNRIDVKFVSNEKDCLKQTSKPSYMSHEVFDDDLVAISKSKVALTLNKPAHIKICISDLSKVLMFDLD